MSDCLGCSPELIKVSREANFNKRSACHKHLVCCRCNRYLCRSCVEKLVEAIAPDRRRIHPDYNDYLSGLDQFLECGKAPDNFVGNCCSIAENMSHKRISEKKVSIMKNRKQSMLGGLFCLPECCLIIENDLRCVDVFGLGKDKNIDCSPHCVLSPSYYDDFVSTKKPMTHVPSRWFCDEVVVEDVCSPHDLQGTKKKKRKRKAYKIAIHYAPMVSKISQEEFKATKGTNTPVNDSNIESFFLFRGKRDVDVSIIVGFEAENPKFGSLLLCRFHTLLPETPYVSNNTVKGEQFLSMLKGALVTPIERRRRGGSSGLFSWEKLRELIDLENSSPRKGSANVVLRMKNNLTAKFYYLSCRDITAKSFEYSPPVSGGQVLMKQEMLEKYDKFLVPFFSSKILASNILLSLPQVICKSSSCHRFAMMKINEDAVRHELHCHQRTIHHTKKHYHQLLKERSLVNHKSITDECRLYFYNFLSSTFINCTLVLHPVGMHVDNFADKKPSLENRLVFLIKREDQDEGRGGFDGFSFCLLDWNARNQRKTNKWTDPKNDDNPHHRHNYPANTRLTDDIWKKFCDCQPKIHLPTEPMAGLETRPRAQFVNI